MARSWKLQPVSVNRIRIAAQTSATHILPATRSRWSFQLQLLPSRLLAATHCLLIFPPLAIRNGIHGIQGILLFPQYQYRLVLVLVPVTSMAPPRPHKRTRDWELCLLSRSSYLFQSTKHRLFLDQRKLFIIIFSHLSLLTYLWDYIFQLFLFMYVIVKFNLSL